MPITAYVGTPGSGKSYSVAKIMWEHACAGRQVWTNIPLHLDAWEAKLPVGGILPRPFKIEAIEENPRWFFETMTPGAILVIDESWRIWPAGLKANNLHAAHKEFLAEHRHLVGADGNETNVIVVAQDLADTASFLRSKIEATYRVVKCDDVGRPNYCRTEIYKGAVTGHNPPKTAMINQTTPEKYDKNIFELYKSHTKSAGVGKQVRIDKRGSVFNSPFFKFVVPAALLMGAWGVWSTLDFFRTGGGLAKPGVASVHTASGSPAPASTSARVAHAVMPGIVPAPVAAASSVSGATVMPYSTAWRLSGFMHDGRGHAWGYVQSVNGYLRRVSKKHCKQVEGDWQCELDGTIVTAYTGQALQSGGYADGANTGASQAAAPVAATASGATGAARESA